jgi:hypothetical protein
MATGQNCYKKEADHSIDGRTLFVRWVDRPTERHQLYNGSKMSCN